MLECNVPVGPNDVYSCCDHECACIVTVHVMIKMARSDLRPSKQPPLTSFFFSQAIIINSTVMTSNPKRNIAFLCSSGCNASSKHCHFMQYWLKLYCG